MCTLTTLNVVILHSIIGHRHPAIIQSCYWMITQPKGEFSPLPSYIYQFIIKSLNFCLDNWTTIKTKGASCMTGRIQCELCGLNYNKQTRKVAGAGMVTFWKCRGIGNGGSCASEQITHDHLNSILAEAKGTPKKPLSLSPPWFLKIFMVFLFLKKRDYFKGKPVERQGRKARRD